MNVVVSGVDPRAVGADLIAAAGARATALGAPERALADADPVAMVYTAGAPLAVVALDPGADGLRTGAARANAGRGANSSVASRSQSRRDGATARSSAAPRAGTGRPATGYRSAGWATARGSSGQNRRHDRACASARSTAASPS